MRQFIVLLFSLLSLSSFSQIDTLFLFNNCYIIGGKEFNQTFDGEKEGVWLEYGLKKKTIISFNEVLWSGIDSLGNDVHGSYYVNYEYAPTGDFDDDNYHKITNQSYVDISSTIIQNWLPPDKYFISSKGIYKNGLKEGLWFSYYENDQIKKKIKFKNGRPSKGFKFFREDGSIMFRISVLRDGNFKVCKLHPSQNSKNCSFESYEDIRFLID